MCWNIVRGVASRWGNTPEIPKILPKFPKYSILRMSAGAGTMNKDRQRQCPQKTFKHEDPEEIEHLEASQRVRLNNN
jgi:hypothetical protein